MHKISPRRLNFCGLQLNRNAYDSCLQVQELTLDNNTLGKLVSKERVEQASLLFGALTKAMQRLASELVVVK